MPYMDAFCLSVRGYDIRGNINLFTVIASEMGLPGFEI